MTATIGCLLLAKLLADHGWLEPEIEGVTPDLRIRKGNAVFVVEARHVSGDFGLPSAYQRVAASLRQIWTRTPVNFISMEVDPRAPLKRFVASVRRAMHEQRTGRHVYEESGVRIVFELLGPLDGETCAVFGCDIDAQWFDDGPRVRAALDEKLKKYPFPLVVALQGIDTGDLFTAAEETLFGTEVFQIPISH